MKLKGKTKRLLGSFALATTFVAAAAGGLISLNQNATVANATDETTETTYETTHLVGIRSSASDAIRFFWRADASSLGYTAGVIDTIDVQYYTASTDTTTTQTINWRYTADTWSNSNGSSSMETSERSGSGCLAIFDLKNVADGDTITIPEGTTWVDAEGNEKYILDQDYTLTYNGTNWCFSEETRIPVGFSGASNGGRATTYFQAYLDYDNTFLANYYATNTTLNSSAKATLITKDGTSSDTTALLKYTTYTNQKNTTYPTIQVQGISGITQVGDQIVLKKGTTVFDIFTLDRDYTFTYIGTNAGSGNCWSMSATTDETDPAMTLSVRGGASNYLNLFTPQAHSYIAQEWFTTNPAVIVNGETKYAQRMHGVAMSGTNYSFGIEFPSSCFTMQAGDVLTIEEGTYILGYRVAQTYHFNYTGSGWKIVNCDGVNHTITDTYTCGTRVCSECGQSVAGDGNHSTAVRYTCTDRECTQCGETIVATTEHTIPTDSYACQGYTCSVCSTDVAANEDAHEPEGEGCAQTCKNCLKELSTHTFPETPDGGWTVDSKGVTVTEQPTCTATGKGTIQCTVDGCTGKSEVEINALGHDWTSGGKFCDRDCGYRVAYTATDMDEILALESLTKYTYGNAKVESDSSTKGVLDGTGNNGFLINTTKVAEKQYQYADGKDSTHNMMVSFSITPTDWAAAGRSSVVWLNAHENGSWGIGFALNMNSSQQNLRVVYRSSDDMNVFACTFAAAVDLKGFALNEKQSFEFGVVQNSDGSYFVFAYYQEDLILTGTLTTDDLAQYANETTHNGLGGAISFRFNGSDATPAIKGTICNLEHEVEGTYTCKDYTCEICGTALNHTTEHNYDYDNAEVIVAGSCTEKTKYKATCVCGETYEYETDYVHSYDKSNPIEVKAATCSTNQEVYFVCTCGAQSATEEVADSAKGGTCSFVPEVLTQGNCTDKTVYQNVCENCGDLGDTFEGGIVADNHPDSDGDNVCDKCGTTIVVDGGNAGDGSTGDNTGDGTTDDNTGDNTGDNTTDDNTGGNAGDGSTGDNTGDGTTDDGATDDGEEDEGCGSSISAIGIMTLLTLGGAAYAVARKRKEN